MRVGLNTHLHFRPHPQSFGLVFALLLDTPQLTTRWMGRAVVVDGYLVAVVVVVVVVFG